MTTDNEGKGNAANNSDAPQELNVQSVTTERTPPSGKKRWPWPVKVAFGVAAAGTLYVGYNILHDEFAVSSKLQSKFFTKLYKGETFTKTVTTPPPAVGNTDVERGYSEIQRIRKEAAAAGDIVSPQVPWQDRHLGPLRLAPIFPRPAQAGISVRGINGQEMYKGNAPHNIYQKYDDIPEVIVRSFCVVEDKNICDPDKAPTFNAAINWWRATQAAGMGVGKKLHLASKVEGGSTLPIQITKNDSWEKGRTKGFLDKAEQMLTASTEMYALGADTREMRKAKILEYINTASFAGHPEFGEIKGVKDAMAILNNNKDYDGSLKIMKDDEETARAFRQVFSLVMAVKMPDESLRSEKGFKALQDRVDNFLKLLVEEKVITASFADKVKAVKLKFSDIGKNPSIDEKSARDKSVDSMRLSVMNKLKLHPVDGMYKLDRWDLAVESTLDHAVNTAVTAKLKSYNDPEIAKQNGLIGFQLLRPETAPKVTWAISINERLPDGSVVTRVSTDTFKGSLDLTKGGRQNYGSTGKMRMAATFLEVMAELHDKLSLKSPEELKAIMIHPRDKLTRWAVDYLSNPANDPSLEAMQRASITTIKYSGALQGFFTGGGMNYPGNFDKRENVKSYTVEEALWESVNLSWYRISDDIEEYMKWGRLGIDAGMLDDGPLTPAQMELRKKYLEEFANFEGTVFSGRAWRQQKHRIASEMAADLAIKDADYPVHMTGLYRGLYPESSFEEYASFMNQFCKECGSKEKLRTLFDDNKKKSKSSAASLLALHTDGSAESLIKLHRHAAPNATYEQVKDFVLSSDKAQRQIKVAMASELTAALARKDNNHKEHMTSLYIGFVPESSFNEYKEFMSQFCKDCGSESDLQTLFDNEVEKRKQALLTTIKKAKPQPPSWLATFTTERYRDIYPETSFDEYAAFMNKAYNVPKDTLRLLFDENNKKHGKFTGDSILSNHTGATLESLTESLLKITPRLDRETIKNFILSLDQSSNNANLDVYKNSDFMKAVLDLHFSEKFLSYKSPVPQAVLDLLVEKAKGSKTKLAVIYTTLYPDVTFEDFESFMRKECKNCGPKDNLKKLYEQHKPLRQIDILSIIAQKTDLKPATLINLYRSADANASYHTVRSFISQANPEIGPFKDYNKEFEASKKANTPINLIDLASHTDRSPEQLAALMGRFKPNASIDEMKIFIQPLLTSKKIRPDYKTLHARYLATPYSPDALYFKFDLNDRGYLARPIHPLGLAIAAERVKNPEITWKQAIDKTYADRIHTYKWLIQSKKKKAQDRSIGIMLDHHAWREIGKQWQSVGYPFKLVPSLATVIGVSGDTAESLATLNSIFLSEGKSVKTTRISSLHFGVGTPHETHIKLGQPKSEQVMRPTTAQLMLEMTRGVVNSDHGTGRRLKDGFKLSDGRVLVLRGKTGTNDESETSGIRVGAFAGTIDDRYSVCISGYITGATGQDKFTSGMAVQALKMLLPELRPLFDRSYGVVPTLIPSVALKEGTQQSASEPKVKQELKEKPAPSKPKQKTADGIAKEKFSTSALGKEGSGIVVPSELKPAVPAEIRLAEPLAIPAGAPATPAALAFQ